MRPITSNIAPHQTLACTWNSTIVGLAGGCSTSHTPAPVIRTPFTSREIPIKNQMETPPSSGMESPPVFLRERLPKNDIQDHKNHCHHSSPEQGLLIKGYI